MGAGGGQALGAVAVGFGHHILGKRHHVLQAMLPLEGHDLHPWVLRVVLAAMAPGVDQQAAAGGRGQQELPVLRHMQDGYRGDLSE